AYDENKYYNLKKTHLMRMI
ncbi:hypothetical protein EC951288_1346B, partial [Escherichia coli 95.1288]